MTNSAPSAPFLKDLYTRMLLTRIVDQYAWKLHEQGQIDFVASCRGHEAAQVGSAVCIEIGADFTLPYYRDLGVVLTIGMTPYEVFRTYLQAHQFQSSAPSAHRFEEHADSYRDHVAKHQQTMLHWGYHKHNTVTGPAPVATQILHAAGIAFASKLRKAAVVTVAYCGDGAITEPDFLEGIRFAALHQLPVAFICEQDCSFDAPQIEAPSCTQSITLPEGLTHHCLDGADVLAVTTTMRAAMQHARQGHGPVLLEMHVTRPLLTLNDQDDRGHSESVAPSMSDILQSKDPLVCCQQLLQEQGAWDEDWSAQLHARITIEVEQALQDAMRDTF